MGGWCDLEFEGPQGICLPHKRVEPVYAVKAFEFSTDREVEVKLMRVDDVVGGL